MKELNRENLEETIKELRVVATNVDNGLLKTAKETTKSLIFSINLSETVRSWFESACRESSKAGFKAELLKSIAGLQEVLDNAEPEKTVDKVKLDELAQKVRESVSILVQTHFTAGEYLGEALQLFKAAGKPAKDWIEWAERECGVKKAQAYNLVKIFNQFGKSSIFHNVSMRVLNIMVHLEKELYNKAKDELEALARKSALDSKSLDEVLAKFKPEPKAMKQPLKKDIEPNDLTGDAMKKSLIPDAPENPGTLAPEKIESVPNGEIERLRALNTSLRETIVKLTDQVHKLSKSVKEKPAITAPYLPQFDSPEPHIVLGLSPVASREEINKQYRAMAAIFSGSTCPEGAKKLKEAKESLLKKAE